MTSKSLAQFYTILDRWQILSGGRIHVSWKCDRDAIIEICQAGDLNLNGLCRSNLAAVNDYFDRQIALDPELVTVVVNQLYQAALAPDPPRFNRNCWYNYIATMTVKAARHIWQKIPPAKQSEELFHRLITPTLNVEDLLAGFDPQYQTNLFVGLEAWTYKVVKYNTYADVRANGDPYFGLSNLGIVARSSYKSMRIAMAGNIAATHIELYLSICKVFKDYLGRSKVSANQVELNHWQLILAELQSMQIEISIDELRGWIDRVGNLLRADSTPIINSYDDANRLSTLHLDSATLIPQAPDPILADRLSTLRADFIIPILDEPDPILGELSIVVARFINDLPRKDRDIAFLRHAKKLKQREIGEFIAKEIKGLDWELIPAVERDKLIHNYGAAACKKLQRIYSDLLDLIHSNIQHPEQKPPDKNSIAIEAIKQILEQYFHN
jgi:hypothetical protein